MIMIINVELSVCSPKFLSTKQLPIYHKNNVPQHTRCVLEVNSALALQIQLPLVLTRGAAVGFPLGKSLPSWLSQHPRMIPGLHWVFAALRVLVKYRI